MSMVISGGQSYGPFQSWHASQLQVKAVLAESSPTTGFKPIATTFEGQRCSEV